MGIDIHMSLVKKSTGFVIFDNLYDGRNSEWFNNLIGRGYDEVYSKLPWNIGCPDCITEGEGYEAWCKSAEYGAYGFQWIPVQKYIKWYEKYRPYVDAGYVTEWENWAYENGRYNPFDYGIAHYIEDDANANHYIFREFINEDCPDIEVYKKITSLTEEDLENCIIYMWLDH